MKKIFIIISTILLLTSCDKYLDIKPYGRTIPKTAEEFAALIHPYLNAIDKGSENYVVFNASACLDFDLAGGDDFEASLTEQSGRAMPFYIGNIVNSYSQSAYWRNYALIRDCNIVIANMKERDSQEANNVLAAAYALRGVAYYQLMRMFCPSPIKGQFDKQLGLPLVVSFDMEARPIRSTLQQTIDQIERDLKASINYHCTNDLYRFTEPVTKGYLAQLYFWTEQWDKVVPLANELIKLYPLVGGEAYKMMVINPGSPKEGNHIMTAYRSTTTTTVQEYESKAASIAYRPVSKRYILCFAKDEIANDVRASLFVNKKRKATKPIFCGMRSAELQLMLAESYAHMGKDAEALAAINLLRSLRIKDAQPLSLDKLPERNSQERIVVDAEGKPLSKLMAVILNERRKEMFMEGDRMFELKRNGTPEFWTAYDGLRYNTEKYMYTMPIPESELRINPGIVQNEGYKDAI